MHVTLMRHFKVKYTWKRRYTPQSFRAAQNEYDEADVLDQCIALQNRFQKVIVSNLKRTVLTLHYVLGTFPYRQTELLNEVPMEPFTDRKKDYGLAALIFMARVQWLVNSPRQKEPRRESLRRASKFVDEFLNEDGDYLIIGHGFFFRLLSRELLKRGFNGKAISYMKNGEQFTYRRE